MGPEETLNTYGKLGVQLLKSSVSKVSATGDTERSIRFEVTRDGSKLTLRLIGRAFFSALETGRGPRKSSTYEKYDVNLEEYMRAKGLPSKTSKKGTVYFRIGDHWFSGKSLAWKINKYGDSLWRKGRGEPVRDVYSSSLEKFVDELSKELAIDYAKLYVKKIKDGFNATTKA